MTEINMNWDNITCVGMTSFIQCEDKVTCTHALQVGKIIWDGHFYGKLNLKQQLKYCLSKNIMNCKEIMKVSKEIMKVRIGNKEVS